MEPKNINCSCPHCHQHLEAPAEMAGSIVDCPQCSKQMIVPSPRPTSSDQSPTRYPRPKPVNETIGQKTAPQYKACPLCGEQILSVAKKCRYCGEFLDRATTDDDKGKEVASASSINDVAQVATNVEQGTSREPLPLTDKCSYGPAFAFIAILIFILAFVYLPKDIATKVTTSSSEVVAGQVWCSNDPYLGENYRVLGAKDGYVSYYKTTDPDKYDVEEMAGAAISGQVRSEEIQMFVITKHLRK